MKNPVGILVTVVVALVVATSFLPQIVMLAAITILVAIAIRLVMGIKPKKPAAAFCGSCGHPNHNGRRCYNCNCHTA